MQVHRSVAKWIGGRQRTEETTMKSTVQEPTAPETAPPAPEDLGVPAPSLAGRAALAVGLFVGFYVLALVIAAGLLLILYLEWRLTGKVNWRIGLFCLGGAVLILWAILPRPEKFTPPGPRLDPAAQTRLFGLIDDIAAKTGQERPVEVYLVPDVNAGVSQRGGIMGFGGRRIMVVGLALLQVLTVSQLRAALAHEFGHYYGGETKLGPWIYRTREALIRTIMNLAKHSSWLYKPFVWYWKMFLGVTQSVSRQQEFVADALAAHLAGARTQIETLKAVHGGAVAFNVFWAEELMPVLNAGYRPPITDGFNRFLKGTYVKDAVKESVAAEIREGKTDPYDSHPSLQERIAAVEHLPPGEPEPESDPPAISLLDNVPDLEVKLLTALASEEDVRALQSVTWDKVTAQAHLPRWQQLTREYAPQLAGITPPMLADIAPSFGESMTTAQEREELTAAVQTML